MTLGDLIVNLKLNAAEYTAGLSSALGKWESMSGAMLAGGAALSVGITAPLVGLGGAAMSMAQKLNEAEISFETMLRSGELAGKFLEELKQFAATTPFEFSDLITGAKRLMALGFEASKVVPMMTALGNAAAGLGGGTELINRMALALGQMQAKGKVSAEEMRQLAEAGVPAWQMLASAISKTTGTIVTVGEVMKMAEKGMITGAEAVPVLIAGMQEKFGGLMENFNKTAMGQFSNLKDNIGFIMGDIGKSLMPLASILIEKIAIPLSRELKKLATAFAALSDPIKFIVIGFAALAAGIGPALLALTGFSMAISAIGGLLGTTGLVATLGALAPVLGVVAVAVAAAGAAWALWQIGPVQNALKSLWDTVSGFWSNTLQPFLETAWEVYKALAQWYFGLVGSGLLIAWENLKVAVAAAWEVVTWFHERAVLPLIISLGMWRDIIVAVWKELSPLAEVVARVAVAVGWLLGLTIVAAFKQWAEAAVYTKNMFVAFLEEGVTQLRDAIRLLATADVNDKFSALGIIVTGAKDAMAGFGWVVNNVIKPAFDAAVLGLKTFLEWMYKIPGIGPLLKESAGKLDEIKIAIGGLGSAAAPSVAVTLTLAETLGKLQDAVAKSAGEVGALKKQLEAGKPVQAEYNAALEKNRVAEEALLNARRNAAASLAQVKAAFTDANKEVAAAGAALLVVKEEFEAHKKSAAEVVVAQERLIAANRKLTSATEATVVMSKAFGVTLDEVQGKTAAGITLKAGDVKATKAQTDEYREYQAWLKRLAAEHEKLNKGLLEHKLATTEAGHQQALFTGYLRTGVLPTQAMGEALGLSTAKSKELALQYLSLETAQKNVNKAMEDARVAIPPVAAEIQKLFDTIRRGGDSSVIPVKNSVEALTEAFEKMGIKSSSSISKTAEDYRKAYETIRDSGVATPYEIEQAWVKYLEAQRADALQLGEIWDAANQANLDSHKRVLAGMEGANRAHGKVQLTFWQGLMKEISQIVKSMSQQLGSNLFQIVFSSDRKKFNDDLQAQEADLKKSLDERTADHQTYLAQNAADVEDANRAYAESMAEAEDNYVRTLAEAEDETAASMEERGLAYEEFVADAVATADDIRASYAESLAQDLAELADNLEDRRKQYEEYANDVQKELARATEDFQETLDDEKKDTIQSIADKKKDYEKDVASAKTARDRKVRDLRLALDKELAEGDKADQYRIRSLRDNLEDEENDYQRTLKDKQEELDAYIAEQNAAYEELVSDQSRRYGREVTDLNENLSEKKSALDAYVAEAKLKAEAITLKSDEEQAKDLAALQKRVDEKAAEYVRYKEEAVAALEALRVSELEKLEGMRTAAREKLDGRLTDLKAALADQLAEYEKFGADTQIKLDAIKEKYRSFLGDVGDMFGDMFNKAGEALTGFVTEYLIGKLGVYLGELISKILPSVGQAMIDVFGNAGATIGQTVGTVGGSAGGAAGSVGGAAGSAGGGAAGSGVAGIVGAVAGVVTAVSSVIGNFQMAHQTDQIMHIEENTRYMLMHIGGGGTTGAAPGSILGTLYTISEVLQWGTSVRCLERIRDEVSGLGAQYINPSLDAIGATLWKLVDWDLGSKVEEIRAGIGSARPNLTINVSVAKTNATSTEIADAIASRMRTEGVLA